MYYFTYPAVSYIRSRLGPIGVGSPVHESPFFTQCFFFFSDCWLSLSSERAVNILTTDTLPTGKMDLCVPSRPTYINVKSVLNTVDWEIFVLKFLHETIFHRVKFLLSGPSTKIYHQVHITRRVQKGYVRQWLALFLFVVVDPL